MTRAKPNPTAAATSPVKAAAGNPTEANKFQNAFNHIGNKTLASSPPQGKVRSVEVDYEILNPLGTCLITFSQHGKIRHAYVYPLLMTLNEDPQQAYKVFRIFMPAILCSAETPDRKMLRTPTSTLNVTGLVIIFDQQQDHVAEANIRANILKIVQTLVNYANNLARRPFNHDTSQTFTYPNEFREGTDFTRAGPHRRHVGQAIAPQDSVTHMERIFETMDFDEIATDPEIMEGVYGSVAEGNAIVTIARPGFVPQELGNKHDPDEHNPAPDLPSFVAEL
jgi:hypothetical protein